MTLGPIRQLWCNVLAAFFSLSLVMPVTYMLFDRDLPVTIHYDSISSPASPGQEVTITWTGRIFRMCDGTFERRITDSGGFTFDSKPFRLETFDVLTATGKNHGSITKAFTLPSNMLPGMAKYQIVATIWCNPLQQYIWPITYHPDAIRFEITNATEVPVSGLSSPAKTLQSR